MWRRVLFGILAGFCVVASFKGIPGRPGELWFWFTLLLYGGTAATGAWIYETRGKYD